MSNYKDDALFVGIAILVVIVDQITKALAVISLQEKSIPLTGFFSFTLVHNTGAGFGLARGYNTLLIGAGLLIVVFLLYYYSTVRGRHVPATLTALVVGGAAGNLIDRVRLGYVVDFLDLSFWPTFNVADMAITLGLIGLLIYSVKYDTA